MKHTTDDMLFEEIMLRQPPPVRMKHARIPIEKIDFDPKNPRLKFRKQIETDKGDAELLFVDRDTAWLKKDIKEKGVIDPIYVQQKGDRFTVVEGNRRTACSKELHFDEPNNPMFATMPARIMPENTTEEQIALLMASFHVSGKVKWDAHEKAGHIYHMLYELHIPQEDLTSTLHMGAPTIKRIALSFEILEEGFKRVDGGKYADQAAGKWSFFAELVKTKKVRERYEKDPQGFGMDFCRWVGEGRLQKSEDVRHLPEILGKKKARELFLEENPADAFRLARGEADTTNPARTSNLYKVLGKLNESIKKAPYEDLENGQNNETAREMLFEAYNGLTSFMERAGVPTVRRKQ